MKIQLGLMAGFMLMVLGMIALDQPSPSPAGSGTFTITAVADNGDNTYQLTVNDTTGMQAGDHLGAKLASGAGCVYVIDSVDSGTLVTVNDYALTEELGASVPIYGTPATGDGWFATSSDAYSLPPYNAKGWDAPTRRNFAMIGSIASQSAASVAITGGSITGITDLAVADGGTGSSTAAAARTALGLAIGTDVQAWDAQLDDIAALAVTDGNIIVGDGANWVAENGATARTSLGLGSIATQAASSVTITGGSISGITDLAVADGGTGASTAGDARTNLGLVIGTDVQAYDALLADIAGLSPSTGDVLYYDGANVVSLAIGSTDQVLTVSGGVPTWAAVAQVNSITYLHGHAREQAMRLVPGTVSASPSLVIEGMLSGGTVTTSQDSEAGAASVGGYAYQQTTAASTSAEATWTTSFMGSGISAALPVTVVKFELHSVSSTYRQFIGFSDDTVSAMVSADDPTGAKYIGLQRRVGDSNWYFVVDDNSTLNRVDTGVAVNEDPMYLVIAWNSTTSVSLYLLDSGGNELANTTDSSNVDTSVLGTIMGGIENNNSSGTANSIRTYFVHTSLRPQ